MKTTTAKKQIIKIILSTITGNLGVSILSFIIGLLILSKTNSAFLFGTSQIIGPIVALLLLPFTGAVIDKYNKQKVIIYAQLFSILGLFIYSLSIVFNYKDSYFIMICILLVFLRIAEQFLNNAYTASVVHFVDKKNIQKLKSIQQLTNALITIISPIFGALIFNHISLIYLIAIEIILEFITIIIIKSVDFNFNVNVNAIGNENSEKIFELFKNGVNFVRNSKLLIFAITFSMLMNFLFGIVTVGLPFLQITVLHLSNTSYGITESLFSIGMIASSIYMSMATESKMPLFKSWKMIILISINLFLLGIFLSFFSNSLYFFILISIFNLSTGVYITFANLPITVWMTNEVPEEYQGRVFNIMNTGAQVLSPLGILVFSIILNKSNIYYVFMVSGLLSLLVSLTYPFISKINLKETKI
ncbi:MAG: MFS transporter [Lactococcus sp.]